MCFTINIHTSRNAIEKRFGVDATALSDFQFNFFYRAFNNPLIPVVTQESPTEVKLMKWGLVPHWVKDIEQAEKIRKGTYNARNDSLLKKPSFKIPFRQSRCWILAKGFFEWQHIGNTKLPWYINREDQQLFAFAGIYDTWTNPIDGKQEQGFSIITCPANPLMKKIHNSKLRMPSILMKSNESAWLDPHTSTEKTLEIISPYSDNILSAYTVRKGIASGEVSPNDASIIEKHEYHIDQTLF